jgi:hypothetical protein
VTAAFGLQAELGNCALPTCAARAVSETIRRTTRPTKDHAGRSYVVSRCPGCLQPIAVHDDWIDVNGCLVHASCAGGGVYEVTPSPTWAEADVIATSLTAPRIPTDGAR